MAYIHRIGELADIQPKNKKSRRKTLASGSWSGLREKLIASDLNLEILGVKENKLKIQIYCHGGTLKIKEGHPVLGFILGDSKGNSRLLNAALERIHSWITLPENMTAEKYDTLADNQQWTWSLKMIFPDWTFPIYFRIKKELWK